MDAPVPLETALRLGLCTLLSALIGLEREFRGRPAGLRTHILVGNGACLLSMISIVLGEYSGGSDSGRVAAAVVSGIGFLGAGAIIRHGHSVRGLTTAASIWVTAAVGVAAGIGWYEGAGLVTALTLIALLLLRKVEAMWSKERVHITIIAEHTPEEPDVIEALLKKHGAKSGRTRRTAIDEEGTLRITTQIQGVHQAARLVDDLEEHGFVESVTTQPELE